ncbi:MAG: GAF domain-containing sensor histidine kinase [Brevinematia bacterium]
MDYVKKVKELEKLLKEKDEKIEHLEKIAEAYNRLTDAFNQELLEADKTVKAYESLQEIILNEKMDADKTIQAYENIEELSMTEKLETEKLLKAQEAVSQLSYEELLHKENVIRRILEINKNLSFILNTDILLHKILKYLIDSVRAERGVIFLRKSNRLIPTIFLNFTQDELKKDYFEFSYNSIYETARTKESNLVINHPLNGETEKKISFMSIPLMHKDKLLGIVYVDMISETDTFSESDFAIGEIFCSQASISLYNSILYSEIKRQNRNLIKLINVKNEFINKMTEYMTSPLNHIIDELKSLYKGGNLPLELRNKILSALILRVEKLLHFVNKVVNFVSLETSTDELFKDDIDLKGLINKIIENYKEEIEAKKLNISISISDDAEKIQGNYTLFKTMLDELISNAIFYNKPEGMVTIKVNFNGERYKFEIIDTGEGIKEEEKEKIFEQFYRGQYAPSLNQKGAGLGLYMVKNLVHSYGGNISFQSEYGEGTKFSLIIPAY